MELVRIDIDERQNGLAIAVFFKDRTADKNRILRADSFIRR